MNMKKLIYLTIAVVLTVSFPGCESFLDTENYTKQNTGNFPISLDDAKKSLTGIYSTLSMAISNAADTHFYMAELASDDRFGGGGENDKDMQGFDHLMNTKPNRFGT
jgi:hypothetical protein